MKTGTQDAVYLAVKSGNHRAEDIAKAAGINKRLVYVNLRRLIQKGMIERYSKVSENSIYEYRVRSSKPFLLAEHWR